MERHIKVETAASKRASRIAHEWISKRGKCPFYMMQSTSVSLFRSLLLTDSSFCNLQICIITSPTLQNDRSFMN